jgi:creatinine amidohydrolase
MQWGEKTWKDIESLNDKVVVVPTGSLEQHGHHLPLLTDTMICTEIARRVEAEVEDVYFLPPLWLGASNHHRAFPGTVSVSNGVYTALMIDVLESLIRANFKRILILNAHGGNELPGNAAIYEIQQRHFDNNELWIIMASWMNVVSEQIASMSELTQKRVIHACELETSMILSLRADLVHTDKTTGARYEFPSKFYSADSSSPSRVDTLRPFNHHSKTGAFGYPEKGTVEKGQALFDLAARELSALVREFKIWPRLEAQ